MSFVKPTTLQTVVIYGPVVLLAAPIKLNGVTTSREICKIATADVLAYIPFKWSSYKMLMRTRLWRASAVTVPDDRLNMHIMLTEPTVELFPVGREPIVPWENVLASASSGRVAILQVTLAVQTTVTGLS